MKQETLIFLHDREHKRVLLAMKKVRFGAGKYNGIGGKIEEGETPPEAAVRELFEESGVIVHVADAQPRGTTHFVFDGKPEWERMVHIFFANTWSGEPVESEEVAPEWFSTEKLPYEKMWADDTYWFPPVLAGHVIDAHFLLTNDGANIIEHTVHIVTK